MHLLMWGFHDKAPDPIIWFALLWIWRNWEWSVAVINREGWQIRALSLQVCQKSNLFYVSTFCEDELHHPAGILRSLVVRTVTNQIKGGGKSRLSSCWPQVSTVPPRLCNPCLIAMHFISDGLSRLYESIWWLSGREVLITSGISI